RCGDWYRLRNPAPERRTRRARAKNRLCKHSFGFGSQSAFRFRRNVVRLNLGGLDIERANAVRNHRGVDLSRSAGFENERGGEVIKSDDIKLGVRDADGFTLIVNGVTFNAFYEATYGYEGFGKKKRRVRYPAGAIRLWLAPGRSVKVFGLNEAKQFL